MNTKKNIAIYLALIAGITILINILSEHYFYRLDFTGDKRYTLNKATRNILEELNDPVNVTAYFSEDLPPQIARVRSDFRDMLTEYRSVSGGRIHYEFINPNKDPMTEETAMKEGVSPVMISVREKDQAVQKKAYLGAVVSYGDKVETIPFMQEGTAMEYALSTAIKKLTVEDKPLIGFLQGHGEPSTGEFYQVMQELDVLYGIQPVTLSDTVNLQQYKTLCVLSPRDSLPESHLAMLDGYLAGGGNLLLCLNRVDGDLNQGYGFDLSTGMETWLQGKGLELEPSFVIDANCASITVQQRQGMFTFNSQVAFPFLPIASGFADNPVTSGLESVIFQFISPIRYVGDSTLRYTPLVKSSEQSGARKAPVMFDIQHKWGKSDFTEKHLVLAALLEGKISGQADSRILLIGDGDFMQNGSGEQAHAISPDNVNLLVNAIDYLSDDTGLISLRTKGIQSRPLKKVEDSTKATLKYANFLIPIMLIIGFGVFRSSRSRSIRNQRMREE